MADVRMIAGLEELSGGGLLIGGGARVFCRDRILPRPGKEMRLSVPVEAVHLFDPQSGDRLGP